VLYFGSSEGRLYAVTANTNGGLARSSWPKYNADVRNTGRVALAVVTQPPTLAVPADQVLDEQTAFSGAVTVAQSGQSSRAWTYSLVSAPEGMTIVTHTGVIAWLPTEAQGPGSYLISVSATDNNVPPTSITNHFTLAVREVNQAPVLKALADQVVDTLTTLTVTNTATDEDLPANMLTYSLVSAPDGMTMAANTGVITWTPTLAQGSSTHIVTVRVTDNGRLSSATRKASA